MFPTLHRYLLLLHVSNRLGFWPAIRCLLLILAFWPDTLSLCFFFPLSDLVAQYCMAHPITVFFPNPYLNVYTSIVLL